MDEIKWERLASMVICIAAAGVAVWYGGRLILGLFLPFVLGWGLSLCLSPLAWRISRRTHIPKKLCAVVLLVLSLSAIVLLIGLSLSRIIKELQALLTRLLESDLLVNGSEGFDFFGRMSLGLTGAGSSPSSERYSAFRETFNNMVYEALDGMVTTLGSSLPSLAARVVTAMPSILLFIAITVIAGFYFCMDRHAIEQRLIGFLPSGVRARLPVWRDCARRFSGKYIRAYLLILLLTFGELFLGLTLLRVEYAFLIALISAAVDILPVLGVGIILVPWAVVALLQRNFGLGIGLLVLYLAVSVLRQIIEPRLVGKSLGLHPLAALAAGYVGWRLLGVFGMALGPVLLLLLKNLLRPFLERDEPAALK